MPLPKLGDVVEAPPLRTVIQLDHLADAEARGEILETFVFTREVEDLFARLLRAFAEPHGQGCFLKGHYGSGKSHCLAFLDRLLQGDPAARLPESLHRPDRPFLPVPVPLLSFSASARLEDVVMESLADALGRATGHRPPLSDRDRFLQNFRELVLPRHPLPGFDDLRADEAERRALEFLQSLPDNPLRLDFDRRRTFDTLQQLAGGRGVVLLLDELSEFLKSKSGEADFNEDIRFLQFLGERAQHMPLWIVAGLQETLEEIGYREQSGYLRIKERYPLRFTLSARHVADLIEGRLIRRKPGAQDTIDRVWADLEEAFPGLIGKEAFRRTYPVHPSTLTLLEGLMPLFSRHRGVVDFVHTRVAGDPLKGVEGLLGEPADRLLTADAIFDHFQERIRETPELSAYDRVAWAFLQNDVPRLFEKERDRDLALRLVKVLILAEISPVPVPRTPADLARTVARRVSRLDPEVNVQYVRDALLGPLADRSSFVARDGEGFRIDLAANVNQVLERRVREKRREARPSWVEAAALVNRASLPLQELAGRPVSLQRLRWQNTPRAGLVGLVDLEAVAFEELSFHLTRLENGEEDFALILGLPGAPAAAARLLENARSSPMGRALAFWLPADPDAELVDALHEVAARRALAAELQLEGQAEALRVLQASLKEYEERVARGTAELYFGGRLVSLDGEEPAPREVLGWERALQEAGGCRMEAVFPRHREIAPESDCLNQRNLDAAWDGFLATGACPALAGPALLPYLMRLGLAERAGEQVTLRVDPARTPVLGEILDRLLPLERTPLPDLERALHKGPFGVVRPLFALLVAALVQSGRVQACAGSRSTALESMRALTTFRVDALTPGRLLDPVHQQRLQEASWLWPGESLVPLTPARQRDLWQAAAERLQGLARAAEAVRGLGPSRSTEALPLERLQDDARQVAALAEKVGTPAGAEVGLRRLAEAHAADLAAPAVRLQAWAGFLERHLREFQQAWVRCQQIGREDLLAKMADLGEDPAERWEDLHREFREADADYRRRYAEEHEAFYGHEVFERARDIRSSPEWQAAERLSGVLGLEPSFAEVSRRVAQLPARCRRRVEDHLVLQARCECGFRPGDEPPGAAAPDLREHLRLVAADLAGRPALAEFVRGLREVGQEPRARRVEEALEAARDLASPRDLPGFWARAAGRLATALDPATVDLLNRALTGRAMVVRRDPAALREVLEGRRLPATRLRALFEEWLRGDGLPDDAWIHVAAEGPPPEGAWLAAWLRQHGLEPDERMQRRVQVDPEAEPEGDPAAAEAALREVLHEAASRLDPVEGALRERIFPGVARDLCRRALRQAASDREVAARLAEGLEDEVARLAAAVLARDLDRWQDLSAARLDWARARHLDLEAGLLTPDLEEALEHRLATERAAGDGLPLREVPQALLEGVPPTRPVVVFLVDALRWDLWTLLKPEVEAVLGPADRETVAEAPLPSVTSRGRGDLLLAGDPEASTPPAYDALFLGRPTRLLKAADAREHRAEALDLLLRLGAGEGLQREGALAPEARPRQGPPEARAPKARPRQGPSEALVLHLGFVDRRAHETKLELWPLFLELLAEARLRLVPLLRQVPAAAAVLLTADHGFLAPGEAPALRRAHGGATAQERLVPAVAWLRS